MGVGVLGEYRVLLWREELINLVDRAANVGDVCVGDVPDVVGLVGVRHWRLPPVFMLSVSIPRS